MYNFTSVLCSQITKSGQLDIISLLYFVCLFYLIPQILHPYFNLASENDREQNFGILSLWT